MQFSTDFIYKDRETKAKYVYLKYQSILDGKHILDVGSDQCYLKNHLKFENTKYTGVGLGDHPDHVVVNLEKNPLPFEDSHFDTSFCLDVLEHLENYHGVFDELCRVSKEHVVISLPNPWNTFWGYLKNGKYSKDRNVKYYGLTKEPEADRHKWFFSPEEARSFVSYRSELNGFKVIQHDTQSEGSDGLPPVNSIKNRVKRWKMKKARSILFGDHVNYRNLCEGTMWWVLERK